MKECEPEPTWEAVKQAIRNVYPQAGDDGSHVVLQLDSGTGDTVGVRISTGTTPEGPGILVLCELGSATRLDPSVALRHNMTLAVGALALADAGQSYVLRHVLRLEDASPGRLEVVVGLLAHEAARLQTGQPRQVNGGDLFAAYAE